jgi:hypothetical protein
MRLFESAHTSPQSEYSYMRSGPWGQNDWREPGCHLLGNVRREAGAPQATDVWVAPTLGARTAIQRSKPRRQGTSSTRLERVGTFV